MNQPCETNDCLTAVAFPSELGWMSVVWRGQYLARLSFGNRSSSAARRGAGVLDRTAGRLTAEMEDLVARLQQFARGESGDFLDVKLDFSARTRFQRAVLQRCRRIPFGEVMSYGQLAARAGFPRSARAVGNVMAKNRIPLIIPCHRVVGSGGTLGGFSAPDGLRMKRRLLKLEGAMLPSAGA